MTILVDTSARKPAQMAVTVSVNGTMIARETIVREMQHHPAPKPIAAWQEAATRANAEAVLAALQKRSDSFAGLAQAYSRCPSAARAAISVRLPRLIPGPRHTGAA